MGGKISNLVKANEAFAAKDYKLALLYYNKALKNCPEILIPSIKLSISLATSRLGSKELGCNESFLQNLDIVYEPLTISSEEKTTPVSREQSKTVDIVIPVFNALDEVKECLSSVYLFNDGFDVTTYVINDGSEAETTDWLRQFCINKNNFALLENEVNKGYTKTVNLGLKASKGEYVVTLNSDTRVTPGWLSSMIACAEKRDNIGIVGPLSNAASWQNVPDLKDSKGNFAINNIPSNLSITTMSAIVKQVSDHYYPKLPFINGFCFLIKRAVIDKIGYLDEENFPEGYGEENDYCLRAGQNGFDLVVADDAYVFHAKSKSFGHEKKVALSKKGSNALRKKYTDRYFEEKLAIVKDTSILDKVRSNISSSLSEKDNLAPVVDALDLSVLFILPVKGKGGGVHSIVQEVAAMRALGLHANIAVLAKHYDELLTNYEELPDVHNIFVKFEDTKDLIGLSKKYDVMVATIFFSMEMLKEVYQSNSNFIPAYYIQDYEPYFFDKDTEQFKIAYESYNLMEKEQCVNFAKTEWICSEVYKHHNIKVNKVEPSLDHEVYHPLPRRANTVLKISAMVRFGSPRRSPLETLNVLYALKQTLKDKVEVHIFGTSKDHEFFRQNDCNFIHSNYGILDRVGVSQVLAKTDLFLDMSTYQAFGRTAIEAMACGCVPVITKFGGADEFAISGYNSILIDSTDEIATYGAIISLVNDRNLLKILKVNALLTASKYSINRAALSELKLFAKSATMRSYTPKAYYTETAILLPNFTKKKNIDYRPTGSAYVRLLSTYPNTNFSGTRIFIQQNNTLPTPGKARYFICQRDMSGIDSAAFIRWAEQWKQAGGVIIYDIDDDLTDVAGIVARSSLNIEEANIIKDKVEKIASSADLITVSTPYLREVMSSYSNNIKVVPNYLDEKLWWVSTKRSDAPDSFKKVNDGIIRIGYIGTPTHNADLKIVVDAIKKIEKIYGNKVQVEVVGGYQNTKPEFGKRVGLPKNNQYINFVSWIDKRVNWDIGIIPLADDNFNKSKSYLKFLEYSALDLAIVCSKGITYADVSRHSSNCLVAENTTESWFNNIEKLIIDADLRVQLAKQAREDLTTSYTVQRNKAVYEQVFESAKVR